MSLRVLHIDTERGWRGGERQSLWLAAELAHRGVGCVVAARSGEPLSVRAREAGLDVEDCNPASELDPLAAWRLRRVVRDRGIGVVHAHTAHAVALGALATLGTGIPLVVARRVDFRLRQNAGTRWKYGRATAIIAVSNSVAGVLERGGVDRGRIRVVPDGVDVHRTLNPASRETLLALGIPDGAPLVVQVAQLVGHKDPVNFVRAVAHARSRVPSVHGLLVGDGPLRADVEREVRALGLEAVLHIAGYRTDADALLAAADVVCLSSKEEGMGSVLLDALVFGRPVAATRAGGIPEVVADGETGLLAAVQDPAALGDAIATLLSDAGLRERLSANARARVNEFSVERMADRTMEIYEAVVRDTGVNERTARANASSSASETRAP